MASSEDLELSHIIQYGSYKAHKAIWSNKEIVAFPLSATKVTKDDIDLLTPIRHTNIIEVYGIQYDCIAAFGLMEYSDCGFLHSYLHGNEQRDYTVSHVLSWMHQVAKGLQYLHSMEPSPFFRHINTKKFLLSDNFRTLKIGGILKGKLEYEYIWPYASPEVQAGKDWTAHKSNVYSFGIVFWELMSRKIPFHQFKGELPMLSQIQIPNSEPIKELIEKCWNSRPVKRPAMEEILSQITHFLKSFDPSILDQVFRANIGTFWNFAAINMGDEIGDGRFGVTYKATWNDTTIAVKKLKHILSENIKHRIKELMLLSNEHIVSILGIAMDGEFTNILMEYLDYGSLLDLTYKKTLIITLNMAYQWMCSAAEVIKEGKYTAESVVYSFGIVFWEVLAREKPFCNYNRFKMRSEILRGVRPSIEDIRGKCPDVIQRFITKCWHEEPSKRHKVNEICDSLDEYKIDIRHLKLPVIGVIDDAKIKQLKNVGESKFGIVYKADWRGLVIGLKKFKDVFTADINPGRKEEITYLSRMDHENIVTLYGIGIIGGVVHSIMEYSNCGSLYNYLHGEEQRSCTAINSLHWMYQAAKGIQYLLDGRPITTIHRNLNSQNMLLFDNFRVLKISDYCFPAEGDSLLNYQDNAYVAPEVFEERKYTKESDVYSFGIVFWEVMSRKKPFSQFKRSFEFTNVEEIQNGKRPPLSDIIESEFNYIKEIIERCWDTDPKNRPTISELVEQLHEPKWFENVEVIPEIDFADNTPLKEWVGKGTFGNIYKANWHNKEIAVQCTRFSGDFKTDDVAENIEKLYRAHHENIVELYGIAIHENNAFILMNYPECITLDNYLHGEDKFVYTVGRGLNWMIQCAKGLAYLQAMKPKPIFHNCLTPSNLFLTENYQILKISDFGIAQQLPMAFDKNFSDVYVTHLGKYKNLSICNTHIRDVFSFGCILWEVMTRQIFDIILVEPLIISLDGTERIKNIITSCLMSFRKMVEMTWIVSELTNIIMISESRILSQVIISMQKEEWNNYRLDVIQINSYVENVDFEDIAIFEDIGSGAFGVVKRARWRNRNIALKQCMKINDFTDTKKYLNAINKETKSLVSVDHKHIMKLYGTSSHSDFLYLLLEYAENGSLDDYLYGKNQNRYKMSNGINLMNQLVNGLAYLHEKKPKPIIHRDLKTNNLLLTKDYTQLKIGDFGIAKELATKNTTNKGTVIYQAPEVGSSPAIYTEKCDIYSFGIILWEVISRRKPFDHLDDPNPIACFYKTEMGDRPPLNIELITKCEPLQNLIESCWNHDPEKRPSAKSIQISKTMKNIKKLMRKM
ncbi:uncharacterized protein LOC6568456 isoform X2 [Drosophila grimshawi]|uniref:uncharacterized protein LOC6568456 isoform X2 n=1 Tax=Drosophila grimshawi TaxID=7222 RepID=UPI000C870E8D|nr:uncharacterized protein LOC6568456 isoform X2 [Drosophila grimshawi]